MLEIIELLGKLHPLLIHFPIALLITSVVCYFGELFSSKATWFWSTCRTTGMATLIMGVVTCLPSLLTGYFISFTYSGGMVGYHKFSAIGLAILGILCIMVNRSNKYYWILMAALGSLVVLTGHLGSTILRSRWFD